ncbi:MAG TPA: TetR/AcrR family transcriptional regulator [Fredinandcohnia sp.]|nr:TetR/AcrR family transcriptional regulator [Fredinandcohnia sp.]
MTIASRREREIARTRQDILEAAARAFARNGYQAVTMQEIAKEAGYTAASLYSYFESKEAILAGLRELVLSESLSIFEQPVPASLSLRDKLLVLFERQYEIALKRREIAGLLHLGGGNPADLCELHKSRMHALAAFLRKNARPEELGGHAPEDVALMLAGIGGAFFAQWLLDPQQGWLEERIPRALDVLLSGLRATSAESSRDQ